MNKALSTLVALGVIVSTASFAQSSSGSDRESDGRQHIRQEAREGGVDLAHYVELSAERAAKRFEELDADGDGMISREEYIAGSNDRAEARFARFDRNSDGRLTREDRRRDGERGQHRRGSSQAQQGGAASSN